MRWGGTIGRVAIVGWLIAAATFGSVAAQAAPPPGPGDSVGDVGPPAAQAAPVAPPAESNGTGSAAAESEGTGAALPAAGSSGAIDADALLERGEYEAAAARYRERLAAGESSAALHYNLGLAYAHLDRLGLATYHLAQAHFLDLGDEEIADSLALLRADLRRSHAETRSDDRVAKGEPTALFWLEVFHRFGRTGVEVALIAFSWLAFGLLFLRRRMSPSGKRDAAVVLAILFLVLTLGAAAYLAGAAITHDRVAPGVVVAEQPQIHEGPDALATRHTDPDLFAGAFVLIEQERGPWLQVRLANGRSGWIPDEDARRVTVPER